MIDFEERLDALIAAVKNGTDERAALETLFRWQHDHLPEPQSRRLLERALVETDPEVLQHRLVVASTPTAGLIDLYLQVARKATPWVTGEVLEKLGAVDDDAAAAAYATIVEEQRPERLPRLRPGPLMRFFPKLAELELTPRAACALSESWCNAIARDASPSDELRRTAAELFAGAAARLWGEAEKHQSDEPFFWWDHDDYSPRAAHLTELLGRLPATSASASVIAVCERAQHARDPYVRHAAVTSLIVLGGEPDGDALLRTAAFAGTRNLLHDVLMRHDRQALFPRELATLERFAEGRLADWLASPWENTRVPAELELVARTEVDTGVAELGSCTVFYFKFRYEPEAGIGETEWQLGVAGPFFPDETSGNYRIGITGFAGGDYTEALLEQELRALPELVQARARQLVQSRERE